MFDALRRWRRERVLKRAAIPDALWREAVAALPFLAIRTKALWVPVLLVVGSTVALAVVGGDNAVTQFMFAYFIQTPAIGGASAGFLAPRAAGSRRDRRVVSAVCHTFASRFPTSIATVVRPRARRATRPSPPSCRSWARFAAAAAWYRRFPQLTTPTGDPGQGAPMTAGPARLVPEGRRAPLIEGRRGSR
jgi:hypothetical protein